MPRPPPLIPAQAGLQNGQAVAYRAILGPRLRGDERDWLAHGDGRLQLPVMRAVMRRKFECSVSAMNGNAIKSVTKIARIFGTNTSVAS
jgi:hypothetical protein